MNKHGRQLLLRTHARGAGRPGLGPALAEAARARAVKDTSGGRPLSTAWLKGPSRAGLLLLDMPCLASRTWGGVCQTCRPETPK